ncbi:MAG TPA: translocation/assembly module TamB domain-containing protein, partial [Taishania sp.]|nr:translocation/assembly module TamB domain-containing protein [Taishania sp.]
KFQPMKGSSRASSGAALDLATNQINSLLSQVSKDYKLNVDMNADVTGGSEYALGVEKGFLDDQLIISGSFGTRNSTTGNGTQSSLIGDIEIEYKLNKDGTFRVNVFNESNDNRGLQSNNRGQFKQGIGIYYKESFNSFKDFKLLQKFLDIFRSKANKRYPIRKKKQQTPVPKGEAVIPEKN